MINASKAKSGRFEPLPERKTKIGHYSRSNFVTVFNQSDTPTGAIGFK
jgi:hypothetical protein